MERARALCSAGRRLAWVAVLCLGGCQALVADNPANCVLNPNACLRDERCNLETQSCETLDCVVNPAQCRPSEFCSESRRCAPKTCAIEAALCLPEEDCNPSAQACEIRRFVLGQPDDASNLNAAFGMNEPYSATLVSPAAPGGTTRLAVADTGNARVLIWNDVPTTNRPADAVLGMPDVHTLSASGSYSGTNERSLSAPWSVTSDGTRLIVGDQDQQRALIWSQIPDKPSLSEPIAANQLWGQFDFESSRPDAGVGDTNELGLDHPRVFFDRSMRSPQRFFISDLMNHRVLTFPGIPESPQVAPAAMVGQEDYFSYEPTTTAAGLDEPRSLWSDGTTLFVADSANNRVLGYPLPLPLTTPGGSASFVLGQPDFVSSAPNRGGAPNQATLLYPSSVCVVEAPTRFLFVADQMNHRVLRFRLPANSADLVLGQPNFVATLPHRGGAPSAATLDQPAEVTTDGTRLVVTDPASHRVLIWNTLPTVNGQPADVVLGQPDGASILRNTPPVRSATQMRQPSGVASDGARLAVADTENHRVLLWTTLPLAANVPPDVILGQASGTGNLANRGLAAPTASTLRAPLSVAFEGTRLVVADTGNHRVLIWNQLPAQTLAPADVVIGQPGFTTGTEQPSAQGLRAPAHALLAGGTLFVADSGYNRVLLYRDPFRTSPTADVVLGQPGLLTGAPNQGGQSARSLAQPYAVSVHEGKLLVADSGNHRVLVWNTIPTASFQSADVLIGQTSFSTSYTRTDRTGLFGPRGLLVHGGRLYVSAALQNRILYWDHVPTQNGERADGVLGQVEFLSRLPNDFELPHVERLSLPHALAAAGGRLLIADAYNNRVVVRGFPK